MSMGARLVGVETAFPAKAVPSKHRLSILVFKCLSTEWRGVQSIRDTRGPAGKTDPGGAPEAHFQAF